MLWDLGSSWQDACSCLALGGGGPVVQLIRGIFQIPVASIDHHLAGTLSKPPKYQQMFRVLEYFKPLFGLL